MSEFFDHFWWGIVLILVVGWSFLLRPARRDSGRNPPGARRAQSRGR